MGVSRGGGQGVKIARTQFFFFFSPSFFSSLLAVFFLFPRQPHTHTKRRRTVLYDGGVVRGLSCASGVHPEARTAMEPPTARTKRAAASKAEGLFRSLVSSGASSSSSLPAAERSDELDWKKSTNDGPDCTAGRGTSDSPPTDRKGRGSSSADGSGAGVEGGGGGRQGQQQTKRKSGGGGGRGAKVKGKVKTTGDTPLKSAGRSSSGGGGASLPRGQPGMKPRPAATSASVARVLGRLGEWGVKPRVPANPTVDDVWKAVDVVLRNLPDTSGLTVDALVGFARIRRSTRRGSLGSSGDGACGRGASDAGGSAPRQMVRKSWYTRAVVFDSLLGVCNNFDFFSYHMFKYVCEITQERTPAWSAGCAICPAKLRRTDARSPGSRVSCPFSLLSPPRVGRDLCRFIVSSGVIYRSRSH